MLEEICFFLLLSSGSVLSAVLWKKRFEEILPVTCMAIVLFLFLFSMAANGRNLQIGVYILIGMGVLTYLASLLIAVRNHSIMTAMRSICTPGFVLFALLFALIVHCNRGIPVHGWDEFSHWADTVKIMATTDCLGSLPETNANFPSYPPAMALFQYFYQVIQRMFNTGQPFSEWRLYVAYQTFLLAMLMPFLNRLSFRKPFIIVASALPLIILPAYSIHMGFSELLIDSFLAVTAGAGLSLLFLPRKPDLLYRITVCMLIGTLVLIKDAGLLFAIGIAAGYMVGCVLEYRKEKGSAWRLCRSIALPVAAVAVPRAIWTHHLHIHQSKTVLSAPVDLAALLRVFGGTDDTYRTEVLEHYRSAILTGGIRIGDTGITIHYFVLFVLLLALLYGLLVMYGRTRGLDRLQAGKQRAAFVCIGALCGVYCIGLCVTYMFHFSEYEALRLASCPRYLAIMLLAVFTVITTACVDALQHLEKQRARIAGAALLCASLMIAPMSPVEKYLFRINVTESIVYRVPYDRVVRSIEAQVPDGSGRIYLVSQESTGEEYWTLRYLLRPLSLNKSFAWSIGEPFFPGDVWTKTMTCDEWRDELASYDYVYLWQINDYFLDEFSPAFSDPNDIAAGQLYAVDHALGKLALCP